MKIPKIFGNRVVLIVIALALLLIVIISLINVGKMAFTGFSSLNNEKKQGAQNTETPSGNLENTDSEGTNNGGALSILVVERGNNFTDMSSNTSSNPPSNTLSSPTKTFRGSGHHGGGGGGGGGGSEGLGGGGGGPGGQIDYNRGLTWGSRNLKLKWNGRYLSRGEKFQGKIRLNLDNEYDETISTFDINFTKDIDLSDIAADSDDESGKSFMHSTSGILENIDLYVPKKDGDVAVIVCSGASDYDEIYHGCPNEEILYLNDSRIRNSSDGNYYIIRITGTGATGVNITNISSSSQNATPPGSADAFAGNVTDISVPQGFGITQAWAGYFGNISGVIQLADSSDYVMYNWSLASPEGEILASTNNSIVWGNIQCFNFTATGTYEDEAGNGGSTNLHGTNLTQLETQYGIDYYDIDGVDETFLLKGIGTHDVFYINANEFEEGECQNTRIIDSSGWGQNDHFEEALLYEPTTYSVVFSSLLDENVLGFDDNPHDFEMLVLENGHGTDTETTTYYFYAVMF